jgi:hypothetical protein
LVDKLVYCCSQEIESGDDDNAPAVSAPNVERFAFKYLPAVDVISFAVLPSNPWVSIKMDFIMDVIAAEAQSCAQILIRCKGLLWIGLFEYIGSAEIQFLGCQQVIELPEVHEPADYGMGWRLEAVGMTPYQH